MNKMMHINNKKKSKYRLMIQTTFRLGLFLG